MNNQQKNELRERLAHEICKAYYLLFNKYNNDNFIMCCRVVNFHDVMFEVRTFDFYGNQKPYKSKYCTVEQVLTGAFIVKQNQEDIINGVADTCRAFVLDAVGKKHLV